MPQDLYVRTSQSFAARFAGEPVSRGPIESMSTCARRAAWELTHALVVDPLDDRIAGGIVLREQRSGSRAEYRENREKTHGD